MGADYSYPSSSTVTTKKVPLNLKCSTETVNSSLLSTTTDAETLSIKTVLTFLW